MKLYALEALQRRLKDHHPSKDKVNSDLTRERSGLKGEKEVDFALRFLDKRRFYVLHNLRLIDEFGAFQLDTLILSTQFMLILEVKNWYGTVIFGENGQVTRIADDGTEEGFPNPVAQAQLQQHRLIQWLQTRGLPHIPIGFLVVISFPSTIIKSYSPEHPIPKSVIHTNQILLKIIEFEKVYRREAVNITQLKKLSNLMIELHSPADFNLVDRYMIKPEDIIKGVICPRCSHTPMNKINSKWCCRKCGLLSTEAHIAAFNDYLLLIGKRTTNNQMRDFLQIDSIHVMKYLIQKANFKASGKTRGRTYELRLIQSPDER